MPFHPKISIITVVYNNVEEIEGTIQSVLGQDYAHIEYLVIDGQSNDGTMELIKKYEDQIHVLISEKDQGLYDAMNKGLKLATGDFVWFMNGGDRVLDKQTVTQMVSTMDADTDIVYGEVVFVDEKRQHLGTRSELTTQKLPSQLDYTSLQKGMVVSHQAFLPRRKIAPFYIENNLSADIDWVIKCLKKSSKTSHSGLILAEFLLGGVSKQRHREALWGRFKILNSHYGTFRNLWNHLMIILRAVAHKIKR